MKKFVAITLALALIATCAACGTDMTSGDFKAEFDKFDWENSAPTAVQMEAERLLGMLEDLPQETQTQLSDVREKLEEYKIATDEKEDDLKDEITPDDNIMDEIMPEGGIMDELMPEDESNPELQEEIAKQTIGKKAKPEQTENPDAQTKRPERPEGRPERPEGRPERPEGRHEHPEGRPEGRPERPARDGKIDMEKAEKAEKSA